MTRYQADLLCSLPLDPRRLRVPKIFQLYRCIKLGWAVKRDGLAYLTEAGAVELRAAWGIIKVERRVSI